MVTYQLSRLLEVSINLLRGFFLEIGVTEWAENHPETMRVLMWVRNGVTFVGVVALTGFTGGIGTAVLGVLHNPVILGALTGLTIFEIGVDGHGIINPVIGDIEQNIMTGIEVINLLGGVFIGVPHLLSHVNWTAINYFDVVEFNHLGWEWIISLIIFFLKMTMNIKNKN